MRARCRAGSLEGPAARDHSRPDMKFQCTFGTAAGFVGLTSAVVMPEASRHTSSGKAQSPVIPVSPCMCRGQSSRSRRKRRTPSWTV